MIITLLTFPIFSLFFSFFFFWFGFNTQIYVGKKILFYFNWQKYVPIVSLQNFNATRGYLPFNLNTISLKIA